jgi:chorismate synthase
MPGNLIGERFVTMSFGESHGICIGAVIDGCPAGLPLTESDIQQELDKRKPGQSVVSTQRMEADKVTILSGLFNNITTGAPICMIIWNKDSDSRTYDAMRMIPRPGHSDYTSLIKYGGFADYRGSGRFSGRLTATFVMAGAVSQKLLHHTLGVETLAYTKQIGNISLEDVQLDDARKNRYGNDIRCPDIKIAIEMREAILKARREGDSLGGIVESMTIGLPVGLGEPIFGSLESDLSRALFSIPAVKAVEFGSGFKGCSLHGSENNDSFYKVGNRIVTKTNNSGGILGGLSNGMPLIIRVGFKPAASILKPQRTLNLSTGGEVELSVPGRHDPCVVPRAAPVVESMVSMVLADHAIRCGQIPPVLKR